MSTYSADVNGPHMTDHIDTAATPNKAERLAYSLGEVARLLGLGRNTAYQAAQSGEIPTIRIGRRRLVPAVALQRLLECGGESGK